MKKLTLTFFLTIIFFFFAVTTSVFAKNSSLSATIIDTNPARPVLVLTNTSNTACQVVNSALGTVSVSRMQQDAKEISPLPFNAVFDDGLEEFLTRKLQTLNPGDKVEIPLLVAPYESGQALQSVTWSKQTGAFAMMYPFDASKPYLLTVTYSSPITAKDGAPMCSMVTAMNGKSVNIYAFLKSVIPFFVIVVLLIIIALFVRRSKKTPPQTKKTNLKKKTITTALIFAILFPSCLSIPKLANAVYTVPESSTGAFDTCLGVLDSHPDITGDVLNRLDGARIDIFITHDGSNWAADWPDGSYRIYWDPSSEYNYYSDDGSVIPSTPCDRLFHEMYHVYELMNDSFSRQYCGSTGIEMKEYNAVRAQNRLRERLGLPPRTHYGTERLPDSCDPTPPPESECTEGESCGEDTGEPHLKTFDGLRYDFQAVGEFALARSESREFEIQTRQSPAPNARDVSMNTAVAMHIGESTVELQLKDRALQLFVNQKVTPLTTIELPGGGKITPSGENYVTITWPDGSELYVNSYGVAIDLIVKPSPTLAGKMQGLLGNFNGDSSDDLVVKSEVIEPEFDQLYQKFADEWRLIDANTLFTYLPGMGTKDFTDRSFPDRPIKPDDLIGRAPAEALCNSFNILNPDILANCIFDVAWTGRPEFAYAAKTLDQATSTIKKTVNYGGQTWKAEITRPGETAELEFEGKEGENMFIDFSDSNLKYQCGGFGIKNSNGISLATGCIVDGSGYIDTLTLPTTGKYTIYIDPAGEQTGSATVQIIKVIDDTTRLTINAPAVTARLTTPGSRAKLTFSGTAGQKIYVNLTAATIPDQCGGIGLIGPGDNPIGNGCLTNHEANFGDGIVLPETGTYTISIDPAGENTGEVKVRVTE